VVNLLRSETKSTCWWRLVAAFDFLYLVAILDFPDIIVAIILFFRMGSFHGDLCCGQTAKRKEKEGQIFFHENSAHPLTGFKYVICANKNHWNQITNDFLVLFSLLLFYISPQIIMSHQSGIQGTAYFYPFIPCKNTHSPLY
jgi:hypothetical protein